MMVSFPLQRGSIPSGDRGNFGDRPYSALWGVTSGRHRPETNGNSGRLAPPGRSPPGAARKQGHPDPAPRQYHRRMSPVRPTVQVVGRRMDAEHYRLRDFLTRTAQPYDWYEAGTPDADRLLEQLGLVDATLPVLVDRDQKFTSASVESIVTAWGGNQPAKQKHYDFVVIGAGPAGPPAAPVAGPDRGSPLPFDAHPPGGPAPDAAQNGQLFRLPPAIGGAGRPPPARLPARRNR